MDDAVLPNLTSQLLMQSSLPLSEHRMVPEQGRSWDPEDSFPPHPEPLSLPKSCAKQPWPPQQRYSWGDSVS